MSKKCDNCKKNITKSMPGLECSKCEKIVHLNTRCTGLTNKQLTALKLAPSLEWTCPGCQQDSPRRGSSIIVPDEDDDDEEDSHISVNTNQLLHNITREVEKAIKREMREVNEACQFQSAKLEEVIESIEGFKKTIKALERKNTELTHKNNNLDTRVGVLEQQIQEMEQAKLSRYIEIANVPYHEKEEVKKIVDNMANHLKQSKEAIKSVRRFQGKKTKPANITVELINEEEQEKWLVAARSVKTTVSDIKDSEKDNRNFVYVREAMTKLNKQIFWNAKQELKINQNFKYVWIKRGYVLARKDDGGKTFTLRSMSDVQALSLPDRLEAKSNN